MRALVFDQTLSLRARHPEPPEADGDTLLRIRQAGICATDLEITRGYMEFRGVPGHEFVADVVASADKDLVGQRVVGEINIVCGRCDLCLSGLASHCRNRKVLGIAGHDGVFAEFVRVPAVNLHVLPKTIDDDEGVFVEPLAAAFQILKQINFDAKSRKWVTVLGDGRLGLLVGQVLRNAGSQVRVIGKHPEKLALCEKWQIRSRPLDDIVPRHDQDVVVDCSGKAAGFEMAMQMVRPRGTIVLKSTAAAGKPMNLAPLVVDEITVLGSRCGPFREAIAALAEKQIDVVSLIQRRMKLEQAVEAMELAGRTGVLKVLLKMEQTIFQDGPMPKDFAIILNNGSINSAVVSALAAQKYRPILIYGEMTGQPGGRGRAAFDQQVAHFKPYRDYAIPLAHAGTGQPQAAASYADPRQGSPLAGQMLELLPLIAVAARAAVHHQAAAIYLGARVGTSSEELAQATEFFQIWNELIQMPCGQAELEIVTPLLELEAWQVVDVGYQVNAPFERTWSCSEEGNDPCWACRGCRGREAAFQQAAKPDPLRAVRKA